MITGTESKPISPHGDECFSALAVPFLDLQTSVETEYGTRKHWGEVTFTEHHNSHVGRLYGGYSDCIAKLMALAVTAHHRNHLASVIIDSRSEFMGSILPGTARIYVEYGGTTNLAEVEVGILALNRNGIGPKYLRKFVARMRLLDPSNGKKFNIGFGAKDWLEWFSGGHKLPAFSGPSIGQLHDLSAYRVATLNGCNPEKEVKISSGSFRVSPELFLPGYEPTKDQSNAFLAADILCGSSVGAFAGVFVPIGTTLLTSRVDPQHDSFEQLLRTRTSERVVSFEARLGVPRRNYENLRTIPGQVILADQAGGLYQVHEHRQQFNNPTVLFV